MKEYGDYPIIVNIIFYLPYKIAFCFNHIYFNIITLISYIANEGFMNFTSLIYDAVIFEHKYNNFKNFFFRTILLFFVSFCNSFFICLHFGANKIRFLRVEKFSLFILIFIYVVYVIIFFPYQFIVNNTFILGAIFVLKFNFKDITDFFNEKLYINRNRLNFMFRFDYDG